jgi:hypothetical protein
MVLMHMFCLPNPTGSGTSKRFERESIADDFSSKDSDKSHAT